MSRADDGIPFACLGHATVLHRFCNTAIVLLTPFGAWRHLTGSSGSPKLSSPCTKAQPRREDVGPRQSTAIASVVGPFRLPLKVRTVMVVIVSLTQIRIVARLLQQNYKKSLIVPSRGLRRLSSHEDSL